MSGCSKCSNPVIIPEQGIIEFQSIDVFLKAMKEAFTEEGFQFTDHHLAIKLEYSSFLQLEKAVTVIEKLFSIDALDIIICKLENGKSNHHSFLTTPIVPFPEFYERVKNRDLVKVINERSFTSFFQPIVSLDQSSIYGYEFLLRPLEGKYPFNPGNLFQFSQKAGLQSLLDSYARMASIEYSSVLPKGVKRFINFLPSSIYDPNHCLKSTFETVEKFNVNPGDLIFEVVETEKITNINHLKNILEVYKKHGIKVALDDLGSGYATLDVLKQLQPNFAKIDRHLIDHCDVDSEKQKAMKDIVTLADQYGIFLLAEGIEREEEAAYCHSLGIPLGQGYFFGKPEPIPKQLD